MLNICGIIAFFMMYIYDLNLIYLGNKIFKKFFAMGSIILVFATLANIIIYFPKKIDAHFIIFLGLALLAAIGLIYTLFFALKFDDAYKNTENKQPCVKTGVYALCRHPGVHMMILMYLCLYLAFQNETMLFMLIGFNLLNIGYVILQDIIIFPKQFVDYDKYKKIVPFLVPTIKSIRSCIRTFGEVSK